MSKKRKYNKHENEGKMLLFVFLLGLIGAVLFLLGKTAGVVI